MIDLHLHLDGSVSVEDYRLLASYKGIDLGSEFPHNIYVDSNCSSLEEYLDKFNLPLMMLQDELSLAYVTKNLVTKLYNNGMIYAEIRFAPLLHTKHGLTQDQVVQAVLSGLKHGLEQTPGFDANLILCCMKQASYEENIQAIYLAEKYKNNRVVAVDLAGPEAFKKNNEFEDIYNEAYKRKLNITIHSGEACGSEEVESAINCLHAQRIGHGIHFELNRQNIRTVVEKQITFEFCPTSNVQTKSISAYEKLLLREFLRYGISVTINSDNMTISNTDTICELRKMYYTFKLSDYELRLLLNNSINASFISLEQKNKLRNQLAQNFDKFLLKIKNN